MLPDCKHTRAIAETQVVTPSFGDPLTLIHKRNPLKRPAAGFVPYIIGLFVFHSFQTYDPLNATANFSKNSQPGEILKSNKNLSSIGVY